MTERVQGRRRKRTRIWLALGLVAILLAVVIVPPLVSINRYKARITELVSRSLGRPVRLSSVELRLLPRPGFVLTDLTVDEDPSYGVEPVLHANTVTAAIRLWPLWQGRLEISRISVDEASLNLVRTTEGRWNLDAFFQTAANQPHADGGPHGKPLALPYLEATNSRINIKQGFEKLPYSLVNADLSFWQSDPGEWRVRLRGQPARTDVMLDLADTGIVQLEASLHRALQLREMPVQIDLEWKEAQLGQLSRLLIGSDPGWRGDLTGEAHVDGTADSAKITARLRAKGVHRAEFAPAAPLDFDANCGLTYHFSTRSIEKLVCDSPLGDGHIRLEGELPGAAEPQLSFELDRISAQAGLDALRTVRSGFGSKVEAKGTISGKLMYQPSALETAVPPATQNRPAGRAQAAKAHPPVQGALTGSLVVDGLNLSGEGLSQPLLIPKITFEPTVPAAVAAKDVAKVKTPPDKQPESLTANFAVPAGAPTPLAVGLRIAASGYQVSVSGTATLARMRELAHVAGLADVSALDAIAGDPVVLDLNADGPWLPRPQTLVAGNANVDPVTRPSNISADRLTGTIAFRNANWKSDYLANHVEISQATLHLGSNEMQWDPIVFSYGPIKGTATLEIPAACKAPAQCSPHLTVLLGSVDAGEIQSALLGARQPGTLLSSLMNRLSPTAAPAWPAINGNVQAESLVLGPVTLHNAQVALEVHSAGVAFTGIDADLLGGRIHASGTLASGDKPAYSLEGTFAKAEAARACPLVNLICKGGTLDGNGKIELAGFSTKDLGSSAKGNIHFEWKKGAVTGHSAASATAIPAPLVRFDRWTADADIANGSLAVKQSEAQQGSRQSPVDITLSFTEQPKVPPPPPSKPARARRR